MSVYSRRDSSRYWISYTNEKGVRVREPAFTDKASSERRLRERLTAVERRLAGFPDEDQLPSGLMVDDLLSEYLDGLQSSQRSPKWIQTNRYRFKILMAQSGWRWLLILTPEVLTGLLEALKEPPKPEVSIRACSMPS